MRLAIIPARSGSTRIKNKNIIDFCGKPLISYPLSAADGSGLFDTIHVSTESHEYIELVQRFGYSVDFPRIPELAGNRATITEILRWVVKEYRRRGQYFSEVCMIMATAPLIEAEDLQRGHALFIKHDGQIPVLAVASFPAPVERGFIINSEEILAPMFEEKRSMHSQDLVTSYYDAGAFFFIRTEQLINDNIEVYNYPLPFVLPRYKAVDIDDLEDLEMARLLYLGRKAQRPIFDIE